MTVTDLDLEGEDRADFGLTASDCLRTLSPGENCLVAVVFEPSAPGPRHASVNVVDDGTPGTFSLGLSGEGTPVQLAFEPGGLDFGLREVQSDHNEAMLTLRNVGAAPVHLDGYGTVGADAGAFSAASADCAGATLAPDRTCSLQVRFAAREEGGFSAAVRATANGFGFEAPLRARAEQPRISPSATPLAFGQATLGSSESRQLTFSNSGDLPVRFLFAAISGGDLASFQIVGDGCAGHLVGPGESCTVQVRFAPTGAGAQSAALSLFGDGDAAVRVPLSGTGVAPALSVSPSAHDFGAVAVGGRPRVQSFQLRNDSAGPFAVDSVGLAGASLRQFSIRSDGCSEALLQPGQACTVAVRFGPTSAGAKSARLRLGGETGAIVAPLGGEGIAAARPGGKPSRRSPAAS